MIPAGKEIKPGPGAMGQAGLGAGVANISDVMGASCTEKHVKGPGLGHRGLGESSLVQGSWRLGPVE